MAYGPTNLSSSPLMPSMPMPTPQTALSGFVHDAKDTIVLLSHSPRILFTIGLLIFALYTVQRILRPFLQFYTHYRTARATGLPLKLIPFPPGLFSFFAFQILRRLGLLKPGTELHKMLTMGRPDSYELHKEMGDVFLTVSPAGITLIVADPKVASWVNGKRAEFPKPPNTGAIINIYGRNVINADGETWRLHRRVTGPVFSERIHSAVWDETIRQANFMVSSWPSFSSPSPSSLRIPNIGEDTLRLGLNVITGAAYGTPLAWTGPGSSPTPSQPASLSFRASLDQLTAHLMPIFLTPHWALRMAPKDSTWGRAWAAYSAFGAYMAGMLAQERARVDAFENGDTVEAPEENLLTALIAASKDEGYNYGVGMEDGDKGDKSWLRPMTPAEVTGNMFIMLFAGHETSANTLHYALVLLALNPGVQAEVLREVDEIHARVQQEGREAEGIKYERDFGRSKWIMAVMNETLRVYSPTGMTNKWTHSPSPVAFNGKTYVIPAHTRISINGTGIHFNPKVWGDDCTSWRPARWIVEENPVAVSTATAVSMKEETGLQHYQGSPSIALQPSSPSASPTRGRGVWNEESPPPSVPPTPTFEKDRPLYHEQSVPLLRTPSPPATRSSVPPSPNQLPIPTLASPPFARARARSPSHLVAPAPDMKRVQSGTATSSTTGLLKPAKGTYLPFSEGARMCSGRKFASVEFYAVLCVLLKTHRLTLDVDASAAPTPASLDEQGESKAEWESEAERVRAILRGRKPGAVTLQPPEVIPLRFIPREPSS